MRAGPQETEPLCPLVCSPTPVRGSWEWQRQVDFEVSLAVTQRSTPSPRAPRRLDLWSSVAAPGMLGRVWRHLSQLGTGCSWHLGRLEVPEAPCHAGWPTAELRGASVVGWSREEGMRARVLDELRKARAEFLWRPSCPTSHFCACFSKCLNSYCAPAARPCVEEPGGRGRGRLADLAQQPQLHATTLLRCPQIQVWRGHSSWAMDPRARTLAFKCWFLRAWHGTSRFLSRHLFSWLEWWGRRHVCGVGDAVGTTQGQRSWLHGRRGRARHLRDGRCCIRASPACGGTSTCTCPCTPAPLSLASWLSLVTLAFLCASKWALRRPALLPASQPLR